MRTAKWKRLIWLLVAFAAAASAQVGVDAPDFSDDEVAIYRDFLLHYPEQPGEMVGMQDTTVAFVVSMAFAEEPNAPHLNLQPPAFSGRKLPAEILELTEENAVSARATAQGKLVNLELRNRLKLSEIAFDPKHEHAAFVYSSMCGCKGGTTGTVVYVHENGQWKRKGRIFNFRIA